jgi:hypothetical protein
VEDMVLLQKISEPEIVENLRKRFMDDCIYVRVIIEQLKFSFCNSSINSISAGCIIIIIILAASINELPRLIIGVMYVVSLILC